MNEDMRIEAKALSLLRKHENGMFRADPTGLTIYGAETRTMITGPCSA
jgi:hypothetical protein